MSLTFAQYQARSQDTDKGDPGQDRGLVIALLGLVGEAGSLLTEYKKRLRDGESHRGFRSQVAEELGDLLWYMTTIASRCDLSLEEIARANLKKTRGRWMPPDGRSPLFDDEREPGEQLPRVFEYRYEHRDVGGKRKVVLIKEDNQPLGDELTDNAYEDDGYRFHDVIHLAFAVSLGWSPVYRKLLGHKRKSEDDVDYADEVEDGARAQLAEELVAAAAYEYAERHDFLTVNYVDWDLLRIAKRITSHLEVRVRTEAEWEEAILLAFKVWREVRKCGAGVLRGNLLDRTLEFTPTST
jgi:NTP pyrophosphatase (non-canonical NTP hydrolase)